MMKIVTYNVNGLKQRVTQFGSLRKLLDSIDADIICFQETKLSRQELSAELAMADGYESFFSCTRTTVKGRVGYSGVATFCRVNSAFSSTEVALPVAAEEGFTGVLESSHNRKGGRAEGLAEFGTDELLKLDSEGRCVITDHCHFVLFNIYGPRADCDDLERTQFKLTFFKTLQKRWDSLISRGRRIFVVGDLNISPSAIDSCRAGPDFEQNECRQWFRSMLVGNEGPFFDVFRAKHPDRKEAYTCWPQHTGAEEFNYGTRIDHILCTRSCLHEDTNQQSHGFLTCHVNECDILEKFKRWKPGDTRRWKGGRITKLEGSDHAPVYLSLVEIPNVPEHGTPSLSTRYIPKLHGSQQTIVSVLMRRREAEQSDTGRASCSTIDDNDTCCASDLPAIGSSPSDLIQDDSLGRCDQFKGSIRMLQNCATTKSESRDQKLAAGSLTKKRARQNQLSQLSLRSFFKKNTESSDRVSSTSDDCSFIQENTLMSDQSFSETSTDDQNSSQMLSQSTVESSLDDEAELHASGTPDNGNALLEWQRIQLLMQNSIPLCKGHKEPCVPRVVKKAGPNYGRRFYVCARAEGPASNPDASCNYFKWAATKATRK